jgi:hypothetical protein
MDIRNPPTPPLTRQPACATGAIRVAFWVALATMPLLSACQLGTLPPDLSSGTTCVAQDVDGREVRCDAPPQSYPGDGCNCFDTVTRVNFVGQVRSTQ